MIVQLFPCERLPMFETFTSVGFVSAKKVKEVTSNVVLCVELFNSSIISLFYGLHFESLFLA